MFGPRNTPGPARPWRTGGAAAFAAAIALIAGCTADPARLNAPLAGAEPNRGYTLLEMNRVDGRGDLMVMVAFSGGGKRSAAFAHGVLRGLREVPVPRPGGGTTRMLDEIDQISAVSGGTFPAAHYILHRERSFETFPAAFLHRDIEAYIWGTYTLPWNWGWVATPGTGTNDRMAQVYDRLLFQGATYGDLMRIGRPRLSVNTTELATGIPFAFLPQPFDLICSDLARYSLARAVAASNGFPLLFTPITLRNHRGPGCAAPLPPLPDEAAVRADFRQRQLDSVMRRLADPDRATYLHLMDGGIADNLGVRTVLNVLAGGGERGENYAEHARGIRRALILVVDGQAATDPALSRQASVTGIATVLNAVSGGQIDNYNLETLALAGTELDALMARVREMRCAHAPVIEARPCADASGAVVRIALADHPEPAIRARLQAVPTGLTIPREDSDLLVAAGERMARDSTDLRAFISGIDRTGLRPRR